MKKTLLTTLAFLSFFATPFSCRADDISFSEVVLQGLDKVTGRLSTMTVPVGEKTTFEALDIYVRVCYAKPPEETPENASFLEVVERKKEGQLKLFSGWMFSSSPALSAMNHAVYDIWVLRCQGEEIEPPTPEPLVLDNPLEVKPVQPKVKIQWKEEVPKEEVTEAPIDPETLEVEGEAEVIEVKVKTEAEVEADTDVDTEVDSDSEMDSEVNTDDDDEDDELSDFKIILIEEEEESLESEAEQKEALADKISQEL